MIDLVVPDIPESLNVKIKRERFLAKEALQDADHVLQVIFWSVFSWNQFHENSVKLISNDKFLLQKVMNENDDGDNSDEN